MKTNLTIYFPTRPALRLMYCFCCWLICHAAQADFVLDIKDAVIPAGSTGSVDVTIRSTTSDALLLASYRLRIEPVSELGGSLQFADSSDSLTSKRQTANEVSDPNYVFANDSQFFSATRNTNNILILDGSDFASKDVLVGTSERLLARIELDHVSLFPLTASGSYRISLVQSDTFTYFENNNGDNITIDPISFSASNSGLITIVPSAVPEPGTAVLFGIGGCLFYARRRALRFIQGR